MLQLRFILILTALMIDTLLLFDFSETDDWSGWSIENDVVMGGESSSKIRRSDDGNAIFKGKVSLENNGGFASLQYRFSSKDIKGYKKAVLHLKGDGKTYQFRIRESLGDRASFVHDFNTTGDWQTIEIPLNQMKSLLKKLTEIDNLIKK